MTTEWSGRQVLVTGGGGFIASHLVEALLSKGASVRVFVRYNSRGDIGLLDFLSKEVLHEINIIAGDLRDPLAVQKSMYDITHVFHLGALIAIPYSYLHPYEVVETNILGTLNVMLAAREAQVERVVHTSSSEVYGTALTVPISEDHILQGQSPYAASKIGADKIVESFYCSYSLPVVTLRPFNTYGPRQSSRAVIPTIISQAFANSVIRLGNLDARRDLTYVSDTVDGFLRIGLQPDIEGETFNLGSGKDIRIGELAREVIELIGKPVKIIIDPERLRPEKSEVQRLVADPSKARKAFGWEPQISLRDGLIKTLNWIERHKNHFSPEVYQI